MFYNKIFLILFRGQPKDLLWRRTRNYTLCLFDHKLEYLCWLNIMLLKNLTLRQRDPMINILLSAWKVIAFLHEEAISYVSPGGGLIIDMERIDIQHFTAHMNCQSPIIDPGGWELCSITISVRSTVLQLLAKTHTTQYKDKEIRHSNKTYNSFSLCSLLLLNWLLFSGYCIFKTEMLGFKKIFLLRIKCFD